MYYVSSALYVLKSLLKILLKSFYITVFLTEWKLNSIEEFYKFYQPYKCYVIDPGVNVLINELWLIQDKLESLNQVGNSRHSYLTSVCFFINTDEVDLNQN